MVRRVLLEGRRRRGGSSWLQGSGSGVCEDPAAKCAPPVSGNLVVFEVSEWENDIQKAEF